MFDDDTDTHEWQDIERRYSPAFWAGLLAFLVALAAEIKPGISPFKVILAAIYGGVVYVFIKLIISAVEWYYFDLQKDDETPPPPTKTNTNLPPPTSSPSQPPVNQMAASLATPATDMHQTEFEKRYYLGAGKEPGLQRLRLGRFVHELSADMVDHFCAIADARLQGKLKNVSQRRLCKTLSIDRSGDTAKTIIELLASASLIRKTGQVHTWTNAGAKQFPPTPTTNNNGRMGGGGYTSATTTTTTHQPLATT